MNDDPRPVTLALVAHTNAGKTTLARTLLARDVGEVRDAPHVTEFVETHELLRTPQGDTLWLVDTPGFGDSARLVTRMSAAAHPLGWLLGQTWDRWRDRAFWGTQQALRHVREQADVLLYLVNSSEPPAAQRSQLAAEMALLRWVGAPVLVLLNQLGAPRAPAEEEAELEQWRRELATLGVAHEVLPLDAFARCWVQEAALWAAVERLLPPARQLPMAQLAAAWQRREQLRFDAAMASLGQALAQIAGERVPLADGDDAGAIARALEHALARRLATLTRDLLQQHGLEPTLADEIQARVAAQPRVHQKLDEGRAALWGGVLSGALAGLKADIASGGLTLGGGALVGGLLGALGAAGVARGWNRLRGTTTSWAQWPDEALPPLATELLLRYLAVAHFGRGRGQWREGESPPHWAAAVDAELTTRAAPLAAVWTRTGHERGPADADVAALAARLRPLLAEVATAVLRRLYPAAHAG